MVTFSTLVPSTGPMNWPARACNSTQPARGACPTRASSWREHEAAIAEFEKAVALNPNFTDWRFAEVLVYAGHPCASHRGSQAANEVGPVLCAIGASRVWGANTCSNNIPRRFPCCGKVLLGRRTCAEVTSF